MTGAGKGIGRAIAVMLKRFNAQVVAVSRTEADLRVLQKETGCEAIVADLGDATEARRMAEQAGDIDLLVNNAAIAILEPLLETKVESWDATMAVNLRAALIISQVVAKRMIERGVAGSIVNVSSMSSFQALPNHAAYAASKAGLDQLTKVMAVELGLRDTSQFRKSDRGDDRDGQTRVERPKQRRADAGPHSAGKICRMRGHRLGGLLRSQRCRRNA